MWSRRGILAGVLIGLLAIVNAEDTDQAPQNEEGQADVREFNKLLDQVDPPSLHAALHDYSPKKFKHGMFKEDRTAVEAIHKDEPSLASTIIAMAKRAEMPQKRQANNGTTPSPTPPPEDSEDTPTTPAPPADSPTSVPDDNDSDEGDDEGVATPAPIGPEEGSVIEVPGTATVGGGNQPPVTATSTSISPDAPDEEETSTPNQGANNPPAATSTIPVAGGDDDSTPSLTAGQVITTTDAAGVTIVSTIGGGYITLSTSGAGNSNPTSSSTRTVRRSSSTSLVLQTTTLPDGSQSTVTAVTVVPNTEGVGATPTGDAGAEEASASAGGEASLQTGVAGKMGGMGWEIVCLLGGAVGVAMMM
ncbi:MAG: hypothetical protein Q9174_003031 [Haloplaca sp. 1 TL-2023]